MYGLILLLPCVGIWLSYSYISHNVVKYGIIGFLLIPLAFLAARYCLAVPSALFMGDSGGLESGKLLAKGDLGQILAVLILTQGVILGISLTFDITAKSCNELWLLVLIAIAAIAFQILTEPLYGITFTIMYLALNQTKGVDVPSLENSDPN